jgi:magnesium-transporting ATPase (P-type)
MPSNTKKTFVVKEMIAFTSARKRMTVIVEEKESAEIAFSSAKTHRGMEADSKIRC